MIARGNGDDQREGVRSRSFVFVTLNKISAHSHVYLRWFIQHTFSRLLFNMKGSDLLCLKDPVALADALYKDVYGS